MPRKGSKSTNFFDIDFTNDKNLSPEQSREWNDIYASYRAQSILTNAVTGVDTLKLQSRNPDSGLLENRSVDCLVILDYRVKVLIPESEVWETTRYSDRILHNMPGARVDYIIREIDREGECALASRRLALDRRQRTFRNKVKIREGDKVKWMSMTPCFTVLRKTEKSVCHSGIPNPILLSGPTKGIRLTPAGRRASPASTPAACSARWKRT